MEIQKGLVKDQGYADVTCTYGIVDGKQYYFVGEELSNGNIVASTVLKEAIKHAPDTSLGVIDKEGKILIPFENKALKIVNNDLLLVERNVPMDASVINSLEKKNDPLSATRFVTTAATLKDKINNKMGTEGRFLFNDQFSEASIYDINGKNLFGGEYYSFIGISGNNIYATKNAIDSEVRNFSATVVDDKMKMENVETVKPTEPEKKDLDVEAAADTSKNSILDAIASSFGKKETKTEPVTIPATEPVTTPVVPVAPVAPVVPVPPAPVELPKEPFAAPVEEKQEKIVLPTMPEEAPVIPPEDIPPLKDEVVVKPEEVATATQDTKIDMPASIPFDIPKIPDMDEVKEEPKEIEREEETTPIPEKIEEVPIKHKEIDEDVEEEPIRHKKIEDIYEEEPKKIEKEDVVVKDSIIEDVAETMKDLIKQNKEQREELDSNHEEINKLKDDNSSLADTNAEYERKNMQLEARLKNAESAITKLEARNQMLDTRVHELTDSLDDKERELDILKPQVEGKKDLVKLLGDAQSVLGKNSYSYDYSDLIKEDVA